jgi:acyl-homoserine lactone synthase
MLHVVTESNRHLYKAEIEESFRLRYQVFVTERKWAALERPDKREIDQFDTPDAIYLLALDDRSGRVVGGSRLIPTTAPYLLSDVLPQLASREIPSHPRIFEWTRMHVAASHREGHAMSYTSCMIMSGVLEYALEARLSKLVIIGEVFWLPRFLELGWNPVPLGLPQTIERASTLAFTVTPSRDALLATRAIHDIQASVLVSKTVSPMISPPPGIRSNMSSATPKLTSGKR